MNRIYLDNNASTPVDPRISQEIILHMMHGYGNPSSIHEEGRKERQRVQKARSACATYFGIKENDVVFTSGGTESASLLIQGFLKRRLGGHVISSSIEHAAVYDTLLAYREQGYSITFLSPDIDGSISVDALKMAIRPDTCLITLMAANNETGVVNDISAIGKIAETHRIPLIVDAIGCLGKGPLQFYPGVSAMFFAGHKIYAPKGIGLYIKRTSLKLAPLFFGGHQEGGKRPGTEPVSGIIGIGKAFELLIQEGGEHLTRMRSLRDQLERGLCNRLDDVFVNGSGERVSNTTNLFFAGVDGETLLMELDLAGVSASHGSACASGSMEPSRVLREMGYSTERVRSSVRFSIGWMTTQDEIEESIKRISRIVNRCRSNPTCGF